MYGLFTYIWLEVVFLVFSQFMCSHPNLSGKLGISWWNSHKLLLVQLPTISFRDSDLEPAGWSWKTITPKSEEIVQILTSRLFELVAKNHPQKKTIQISGLKKLLLQTPIWSLYGGGLRHVFFSYCHMGKIATFKWWLPFEDKFSNPLKNQGIVGCTSASLPLGNPYISPM